jgi:5-formyltetrahydrofolate cyclo-ligase
MTKFEIRKEYLQKRKLLTQGEAANANELLRLNLQNFLIENPFGTLHTFLPQQSANEVDTWKIISILQHSFPFMQVAVPYIVPGTKEMQHYLLKPDTPLTLNRWRIPEPDPAQAEHVDPYALDVILVPLLAFDSKGFRVGYGGGYYDRFLVQCRPDALKIGLSFFPAIDKIADLDPYDVPMNVCITPYNIYKF